MTATNKQTLEQSLTPGTRVHLIGIGGVSMRPLGLVLRAYGHDHYRLGYERAPSLPTI